MTIDRTSSIYRGTMFYRVAMAFDYMRYSTSPWKDEHRLSSSSDVDCSDMIVMALDYYLKRVARKYSHSYKLAAQGKRRWDAIALYRDQLFASEPGLRAVGLEAKRHAAILKRFKNESLRPSLLSDYGFFWPEHQYAVIGVKDGVFYEQGFNNIDEAAAVKMALTGDVLLYDHAQTPSRTILT